VVVVVYLADILDGLVMVVASNVLELLGIDVGYEVYVVVVQSLLVVVEE
jgi:hypothetical protein